jgi:dTDP-4-dehydrorhamnose 3,5-epimerase
MGKLVRCVHGRLTDLFLDIRLGSPTFGKIAAYDMPSPNEISHGEWIWLPPGFAHGTFFTVETRIEYLCTGEYNPACEAGISPLADDLDWSLCDAGLKGEFDTLVAGGLVLSDKDRQGLSLSAWRADPRARYFTYGGQSSTGPLAD